MRAGFPHSEIHGSKLACQLPVAYRRLQRPSSPVVAKASTTCTCSLDPITLSSNHDKAWCLESLHASAACHAGHRKRLVSAGTDKVPALSYCRLQVAICNHYPDESGLRVRIRFTSSKLLKSSRMKLTAKRKRVPLGPEFRAKAWWSQPGSNR